MTDEATRVAEWLALPISDHKITGPNPAEGGISSCL